MELLIPADVSNLLDIGCSRGNFGYLIKNKRQIPVWGLEPNEEAAAESAEKLDTVICTGFKEGIAELDGRKFDCIVFNDVLEHLEEPQWALKYCKNYLSHKGCVVASIPNLRYFEAMKHIMVEKDFKYTSWGIFDSTHLRFFTKKSMDRLFRESGYRIATITGINSLAPNKKLYKQFKRLNFLFNNSIADMEFLQYAIVAYPI